MSVLSWLRGETKFDPVEARLAEHLEPQGVLIKDSPTWIFVRDWAQRELDEARKRNDSPLRDALHTSLTRGQIMCLKAIISLPDAPKRKPSARGGILEEE